MARRKRNICLTLKKAICKIQSLGSNKQKRRLAAGAGLAGRRAAGPRHPDLHERPVLVSVAVAAAASGGGGAVRRHAAARPHAGVGVCAGGRRLPSALSVRV